MRLRPLLLAIVLAASSTTAIAAALPVVAVYKTPWCGCCKLWVEHLRKAGFTVEVHDVEDLDAEKDRMGVPADKRSCHTAQVAGYYVEGHVPAADIKRLLKDKPKAEGLVLPGMPMGSPGMEMPDGRSQPFAVELVDAKGQATVFARH
jgi:hypothetical protein